MDKYQELEKLKALLDDGAITSEEFEQEKAKVLDEESPKNPSDLWGMEENVYCMLMHLSQLVGVIIPFGGIVAPIVMWVSNKDSNPTVDKHGRAVMNWVLSELIYFFLCLILMFLVIGVFLLPVLIIVGIVFAIIGGVKASNGEVWEYPLSIKFFKDPVTE